MKIIIDTNILFSALLKNNNKFAEIILKSDGIFIFYTSDYLKNEISNHIDKIIRLSGFSKSKIDEKINHLYKHIHFLDDIILHPEIIKTAFELVKDIDLNDLIYIALSLQLDAVIWTGDKKLINGMTKKGFNNFISTDDMNTILITKIDISR